MRYQHTNTSHNRSSGFSSVAEIAGGMGLRSPQPQQLALDFAPAQVRSHGLAAAFQFAFARFLLPSQIRASRADREGSAVALVCANQRVLPSGARR